MKKFLYSGFTKVISVILCVVFIILTSLALTNGVITIENTQDFIYDLEPSFEQSRHVASILNSCESTLFEAVNSYYDSEKIRSKYKNFDDYLEVRYNDWYYSEKCDFFVSIDGKIFTNCNATSPEEFENDRLYRSITKDADGYISYDSSVDGKYSYTYFDYTIDELEKYKEISIVASINDEYTVEAENLWSNQKNFVRESFWQIIISALLAIFFFLLSICITGKDKNGEVKNHWLDKLWTEIYLSAIGATIFGVIYFIDIIIDMSNDFFVQLVAILIFLASVIIITSTLSLARKIKARRFIKTSIIFILLKWFSKAVIKTAKWLFKKLKNLKKTLLCAFSKKTVIIYAVILSVYTLLFSACIIGATATQSTIFFLIAAVVFFFGIFFLAKRGNDLDEIRTGAEEIRNGNLHHKISEPKSEDMKSLAEDINKIGEGLEKSVSAKMRAEKMKTDLITNVSHDLKTPLTSIISYSQLLSEVENLPQEAKDYVLVISKKSEQLKNLTQDLFEISKVQSGNENFIFEKLDASLLINQALAESEIEIKKSGLTLCIKTAQNLYFSADGRKMSRVLGNLIDNAIKYSLHGTRIFISASEENDEVVIEFKNTSAYPMDFDAEEITGRFVRGDESRTSQGNGLGLAIAKSYVDACGGKLKITIDGDLFKVQLKFKKVNM